MSYDSKITETDLNVLRLIEENPEISQRMMASKLGHSLGKINYSIKLLTDIGFLKIKNFSKSQNKSGYIYVLTPRAIKQKLIIALVPIVFD